MPVRIYEIARKHGVPSKTVLAKAKELGIAARVASSSIDKITAEFLEEELEKDLAVLREEEAQAAEAAVESAEAESAEEVVSQEEAVEQETEEAAAAPSEESAAPVSAQAAATEAPEAAPATAEAPSSVPAQPEGVAPTITVVTGPTAQPVEPPAAAPAEPSVAPSEAQVAASAPAGAGTEAPAQAGSPVAEQPAEVASAEAQAVPVSDEASAAPPAQPPPPPEPSKPKLGELVGRIELPAGPTPRRAEKPSKPPQARREPPGRRRPERDRGETRGPGGRPVRGQTAPVAAAAQAGAAKPKDDFVPPTTGELITMKPPIMVRDLAERMNRKPHQLIAELVSMNVWATVNQSIDEDAAKRVCAKFGYRFEIEKRRRGEAPVVKREEPTLDVLEIEDKPEDLKPRPPVVTIMGHVDHGKTTLLDAIRKSNVVATEAGGITQHIGAYTISVPHPERKSDLQQITFLDTPGHAAFSAMRARGANVTDIVVLVVAADDGVMPQTEEALNHARAANVPIIVAVNKIDKPNANPLRVRQELQQRGLVPDDWGGDTIFVELSALTGQGVDKLLDMILLQAELLELKANPNRPAAGNVIESGLSAGGPTVTLLVRKGTLRVGDAVLCGEFYGKVRALINEEGKRLKEAGPSMAVRMLGLNGVPEAGIPFVVVDNEKKARELAEKRAEERRLAGAEKKAGVTLEDVLGALDSTNKVLKVVVKADTQGSVEAIVDALKKIESEKVSLEVIHSAVGTITESDVNLAAASNAVILGFHTKLDVGVADAAKHYGVQIKLYTIIYELVDEVRKAMAGLLEPILEVQVIGTAEVRRVFELSKGGRVAGCVVTQGRIQRGKVRVFRKKNLLYEGAIQTLRRFQDDVNEVRAGMECGIRIDGFDDFQEGDLIESIVVHRVAQEL